jgi:hypothetical protein
VLGAAFNCCGAKKVASSHLARLEQTVVSRKADHGLSTTTVLADDALVL